MKEKESLLDADRNDIFDSLWDRYYETHSRQFKKGNRRRLG